MNRCTYAAPPRLFMTGDHGCGYLPKRLARNLVVEPGRVDSQTYHELIQFGFRRSGSYLYRPHCRGCQACQSLRIQPSAFMPYRSQRRVIKRNRDLSLKQLPFRYSDEHYELFVRYVNGRHPNGGMDDTTPTAYREFLVCNWADTWLWELRDHDRLMGAAVVDHLGTALSAVYTYYEPQLMARSLGTYAILRQLAEANRQNIDWVYLGYLIEECPRMAYKARFRPYQLFGDTGWSDFVT